MAEHYTMATVAAQEFCPKCMAMTMHRIEFGRKGPCLSCVARLEKIHEQLKLIKPDEEQLELFK